MYALSLQSCRVKSVASSSKRITTRSTRSSLVKAKQFHISKSLKSINPLDSVHFGSSADYVDDLYKQWKADPSSIDASTAKILQEFELSSGFKTSTTITIKPADSSTVDNLSVFRLVNEFRQSGHKGSDLDPLGLSKPELPAELELSSFGFSSADLNKEFYFSDQSFMGGSGPFKLSDIVSKLKRAYCSTIGIELSHLEDAQKQWLQRKVEDPSFRSLSGEERRTLMERLIWADHFENFLSKKFGQTKRFGLEGGEILIPGMKTLIDTAAGLGIESVVIGMAHRGRLNTLANIIRKPLEAIFKEFAQLPPEELKQAFVHSGDVKYHLGTSTDRVTRNGKQIHLALMSNPSHLEAVDPVVEGKTRAKQYYSNDVTRSKVMSMQIHGDAAMAGQGIVYETFQMSGLQNYTTGGSIHIVINNQVGFTTDPSSGRSTRYCTDIAKTFGVPVFHVNGDDAEAVVSVCRLAAEWRQTFHKDVVIDIVCYRKFGHNELDEPKFTQPTMYGKIGKHQPILQSYIQKTTKEGTLTKEEVDAMLKGVNSKIEQAFAEAPQYKSKKSHWLESRWHNIKSPEQLSNVYDTAISRDMLSTVGKALYTTPQGYKFHPAIQRDLNRKQEMFKTGEGIDWATGEALAFGSLLHEGIHVRLSGQDVERGTFSHRHAVLHDQTSGSKYTPLNNISDKQAKFIVTNSFLSEYGVLGFELGYSLESPNSLVLWEAQFGDFSNGAQIIIDQFISSGEQKWYRQSGLVMLLPHGYDGQGPEHSSARLERFLQLCDSDPNKVPQATPDQVKQHQETNMQVVNITTPANYFHALRRQIMRDFRKPLIVMSPKNLLRHPLCKSSLSEFDLENPVKRFQRVIPETYDNVNALDKSKIRKVIFCSGKVYYDLVEERASRKINDIAIVRVEQICPFPFDLVREQASLYPKAEVVWCQEEPMNAGAWTFIQPHMETAIKGIREGPKYVGRHVSAAPAAGTLNLHKLELAMFLDQAFA